MLTVGMLVIIMGVMLILGAVRCCLVGHGREFPGLSSPKCKLLCVVMMMGGEEESRSFGEDEEASQPQRPLLLPKVVQRQLELGVGCGVR